MASSRQQREQREARERLRAYQARQEVHELRGRRRRRDNVLAIAGAVEDALIEAGAKPLRREGRSEGRWVLLDFGDIVVHVFHEEERLFYSLERLWKDAPVIDLELPAHDRG